MGIKKKLFLTFAASMLICPSTLIAGGFQVLEQSGEGTGNANAGATAGYGDGSEIAINPGAMGWIEGTQLSHTSHLVISQAEFTNTGSSNVSTGIPISGSNGPDGGGTAYVPNIYLVHQLNDQVNVGLGVNAPFGLTTEYDSEWVGRYHAIKSELTTIDVMPAVSFKPMDNLSLGIALDLMYADAELTNAVDYGTVAFGTLGPAAATALGLAPQSADGIAKVDGDDWAYGYHLGAAYKYDDSGSRIGLSYHSKVDVDISGNATFGVPTSALALTSTGAFTDTGASASVSLPEYVNVGWIHNVNDRLSILGELAWTRWSRFDELRVQFDSVQPDSVVDEGWDNTWRAALALNYKVMDNMRVRTGFTYDESPISDDSHRTPRIPGNDRKWLALGVDYDFTEDVTFGINYAHVFVSDNTSTNIVDSTGNNLVGDWDLAVDLINVNFIWNFS
jgi:long-chain fatty acid transport protein